MVGFKEERIAKLSEDGVRIGMKQDVVDRPHPRTDWTRLQVVEVARERNLRYEGLSIAEIAGAEGKEPLDAFLDIALDEDLETEFAHPSNNRGDEVTGQRLKSPFVHISVSDGGAHTRFLVNSVWPVYFLGHWVRDEQLMTLEQAHNKMSALPAWFSDMKDRGTLRVGDWADVMVYNLDELGLMYDKPKFETDFPGGEKRLVQKPTGMRYILVNGAAHLRRKTNAPTPCPASCSAATIRSASRQHRSVWKEASGRGPPSLSGDNPEGAFPERRLAN